MYMKPLQNNLIVSCQVPHKMLKVSPWQTNQRECFLPRKKYTAASRHISHYAFHIKNEAHFKGAAIINETPCFMILRKYSLHWLHPNTLFVLNACRNAPQKPLFINFMTDCCNFAAGNPQPFTATWQSTVLNILNINR